MAGLIRRVRMLFHGRRFREELDEELQFHLDMTRERLAEDGVEADEAQVRAARQLRSPLLLREQAREAWGLGWLDRLLQDVRYAGRLMVRRPGFTLVAIAVLALGLGASTTVFSVVYGVLMRPLPFERSRELVLILEGLPKIERFARVPVSPPDVVGLTERQRSFTQLAAFKTENYELAGTGDPERVPGARVAAALFPTLGRQPMLGRAFTEEEDRAGHRVAILSWGLWQRRFLADPAILGRSVLVDRQPYQIVGVMPPSFEFPLRGLDFNGEPAGLFVPLSLTASERAAYGTRFNFSIVGRLRPDVTLDAARTELARHATTLQSLYPAPMRSDPRLALAFEVTPLQTAVVGAVTPLLWVLFGAVTLVLLVGCADLGGLLLTRAATRAGELRVRAALGAGRGRLIRQLMTESLVIAAAGAVAGLALGAGAMQVIASQAGAYLPRAQEIGLDATVVAGMAAFTLLSALAFGFAPALWITGAPGAALTGPTLANRRATAGRGERRLLGTLVVVQVTLALVLAVGAGLMVRSLERLLAVDPGFRPAQAVAGWVRLPDATYPLERDVRAFIDRLLPAARALPGARAAALASTLPMHLDEHRAIVIESPAKQDETGGRTAAVTWVTSEYFTTLQVPLREGRYFAAADDDVRAARVVVINETMARRAWGDASPLGRRVAWGIRGGTPLNPWLTVVGVVADVKQGALSAATLPEIYQPLTQYRPDEASGSAWDGPRQLHVIVRADGTPEAVLGALRQEVARLDPALPLTSAQTLETMVASSVTPQRFTSALLGAFALAAVLLAALGLYGLLSSVVTQRTREIGVRVALGAQPADVLRLIVRQGVALVFAGLAFGLAAALLATRAMKSLLFGVQPFDPLTFALVAATLAAVGLLASLLPAWRAARVDPVRALRAD